MSGYYDLGTFERVVTTGSEDAQRWFNLGLRWFYGFNHAEAVACFERAVEADPTCAMAHWGVAMGLGPNYNLGWDRMDERNRARCLGGAFDATQSALALVDSVTAPEATLINALPARYPQRDPIEDQMPWNKAFTNVMREAAAAHPDDADVQAVFVDAIMNETPWKMWDLQAGEPAEGAGTVEARQVLESAFAKVPGAWDHPALLHLYVHLMEMSPMPELALRHGDRLREMMPECGHLIHMPTHIDVLCGNYHDVVHWNQKAVEVDRIWFEREGPMNVWALYAHHNQHFVIYGAMFAGQYQAALAAADELIEWIPEDFLRIESPPFADSAEAFISMRVHVLVRFGKWQEIIDLALPEDQELYCATTAMTLYAKAVAHSALGNIDQAEQHRELFLAAIDRVPDTRRIHNNTVLDLLEIASAMVDGELDYRRGEYETAFAHLRRAVSLEDGLAYDEPWGWIQPARHALGALLLEQQHFAEAEQVYRADLGLTDTLSRSSQNPGNMWSLFGLHECLLQRGETEESALVKQQLDIAVARADIELKASCFCHQAALAATEDSCC